MDEHDVRITDATPCPCGSDNILHDRVDEEDIHWCAHCGRQVVYEDQEIDVQGTVS